MRVGSLFAGIGGFDLGFERAGMRTVWQVEQDAFCRDVLARHFPDAERFGDVREVGAGVLAPVDLLAGGFPCQPVSDAGRRKAQDDARWLWPEFARLIRELRPRYVVVENVPGLLRRGFGDVLGDLAAGGYDAEWDCVPAAAFGAPHLRDRVWLVAYPAGEGREGQKPEGRIWGRDLLAQRDRWSPEPDVPRVANGVPGGVDRRIARTRALGNALVPQIAEWIGRQILEHEKGSLR